MNSDFELTANAMAAAPGRVTGLRVVPGSRHCDRPPTVEEYLDLLNRTHVSRRDLDLPIVLVLGDPNERYTSDDDRQLCTIYLYRSNERLS